MMNNISRKDHELNKLFDSVKSDTPDLSREELLGLITENRGRKAAPVVDVQKTTVNTVRNGIFIMLGILGLATIAYFSLFAPQQQERSAETTSQIQTPAISSPSASSQSALATDADNELQTPSKSSGLQYRYITGDSVVPDPIRKDVVDPKRWEMFVHKPIDLAVFKPISIDEEKLASLGLLRTDSGEVIYYHKEYKFGFPMYEYIRQFTDDKDPNLKILGMRPFYAQYVTDSRGNMMMHYENKTIKGGTSVMVGIFDRDLSELLKNIKYYGNHTLSSTELFADTVNDILELTVIAKAGAMRLDTVLEGKLSDKSYFERSKKEISSQIRAKDSVFKMSLGGMDAIAKEYAFDFTKTSDPLVKRVKEFFDIIDKARKTELERLSDKRSFVEDQMDKQENVANKLRLEQLSFKLSYEAYIEQSKLQAAELANPVDLIAVDIRPATGLKANPKLDDGLIFWYKDSDTLRSILDASKAAVSSSNDPKLRLSVMPNPAMLYLYVNYTVEEACPLRLTLADITGKQVYTEAWKATAGSGKREINVQQFPAGIYMLILDSDRGRTTRQVIIQHQ